VRKGEGVGVELLMNGSIGERSRLERRGLSWTTVVRGSELWGLMKQLDSQWCRKHCAQQQAEGGYQNPVERRMSEEWGQMAYDQKELCET
jgi:hypothetical protein